MYNPNMQRTSEQSHMQRTSEQSHMQRSSYQSHMQNTSDQSRRGRPVESLTLPSQSFSVDNFRPFGQQGGALGHAGGAACFVPGNDQHVPPAPAQTGLHRSKRTAFHSGLRMNKEQGWQLPGFGRDGFAPMGREGFGQLPAGDGRYGGNVSQEMNVEERRGSLIDGGRNKLTGISPEYSRSLTQISHDEIRESRARVQRPGDQRPCFCYR